MLRLILLLRETDDMCTFIKEEGGLEFDTYIVATRDLDKRGFRLLDVDNRAVLPVHTQVRILISSGDVLYS